MRANAKAISLVTLTALLVAILSFVLTEIGYRLYMRYDLMRVISSLQPDATEVIGFTSFPHPMVYNAAYGHDFYSGPFVTGAIKGNRFDLCQIRDDFDGDGNVKARFGPNLPPARTILLFGSSFTLTTDESGATATDIAAAVLSERSGKPIRIINFSRGSFGILQMLDMARVKIPHYRPELVLFVFNTSDTSRPRNWPIFEEVGGGYFNFYMSRSSNSRDLNVQMARLSPQVVSSQFTPDWCRAMMAGRGRNDERQLVNDPVVRATVERFRTIRHLLKAPQHNVDLMTVTTSYVWLRLRHGNPYHESEVFAAGENPIGPITIDDFRHDPGFVSGLGFLREAGVPYVFVHLPSFAEMKAGEEFKFGIHGVPGERETKLVASLREATGRPIASLLRYMNPPVGDAEVLVNAAHPPNMDWHPNALGTHRIGLALADLIADRLREP